MRNRLPFSSTNSLLELSLDLNAIDQSRYNVSDLDNDVAAIEEFVRNDERSWVTIILKDPTSALEEKRKKSEREVNGTYERENKGKKRERKEKKMKKMKRQKREKEEE